MNPAFLLALLIGLSLGIIGSGGSILTVPVLVYLFHIDPFVATTYSLFIVGSTSLLGASQSIYKKTIDIKAAMLFAIPSLMSVFIMRRIVIPFIPEFLSIGDYSIDRNIFIMIFFAVLMITAAVSMLRSVDFKTGTEKYYYKLPLLGIGVGMVTGLVGAGGGFLIIPSLILFANVEMKNAVGTSLLVITINCFVGFMSDIKHLPIIDWHFLLLFTSLALAGIITGIFVQHKIQQQQLKKVFAYFIILMACYIFLRELF